MFTHLYSSAHYLNRPKHTGELGLGSMLGLGLGSMLGLGLGSMLGLGLGRLLVKNQSVFLRHIQLTGSLMSTCCPNPNLLTTD